MKVVIFGSGGHGRVLYDILRLNNVDVVGFLDDAPEKKGKKILDTTILGGQDSIDQLKREKKVDSVIVALAGVKANKLREDISKELEKKGLTVIGARHPRAIISPYADVHPTAQILVGAIVNPGARVSEGAIVNTYGVIDHDATVGKYAHVAPQAGLMGEVKVGDYCYIGANANIIQTLSVGNYSVVGAGAEVLENVPDYTLVAGVPAVIKKNLRP